MKVLDSHVISGKDVSTFEAQFIDKLLNCKCFPDLSGSYEDADFFFPQMADERLVNFPMDIGFFLK